jgi:hypothetical protein
MKVKHCIKIEVIETLNDELFKDLNEEQQKEKVIEVASNFKEDVENFVKMFEDKGLKKDTVCYRLYKIKTKGG